MASYDGDITLTAGLDASDVIDTSERLSEQIERIFSKSSGVDVSTSFKTLLNTLDKLQTSSAKVYEDLSNLEGQQIPTAEYANLQKEIDKTSAKIDALKARKQRFLDLGGDPNSRTFEGMNYDIAMLEDKLQDAEQEMQNLVNSGKAFVLGEDTEQYANLLEQLNQINNAIIIARERLRALNEVDLEPTKSSFQELKAFLGDIIRLLGRGVIDLARLTPSMVKFGASIPIRAFKQALSLLNQIVSKVLQLGGRAITSGIKKLGSAIAGLGKHSKGTNDAFQKGFKTFIRYGLGVRSVYALVNKIRRAIIEGFQNLAQVHEPFNVAMSNLKTALAGLKNSFSSAFAPLIEFVEPALTRFINLVSEAVSKLGMFIAALTGKEFVKATAVQQNYAESIKNSGSNSDSASKSLKNQNKQAKELKKTLAGFDDINILQEDNDTDTGNSGSSGGTPEATFDVTPVDGAIKTFADKLKELWKLEDLSNIGRILGNKLLTGLKNIPWDKIKKSLAATGKRIATLFNGFFETPGLFDKIGETLAEVINSKFTLLESFVSNFHWVSFGKAIKDGLLGVVNNIDWDLIFSTLRKFGKGFGSTLYEIFGDPQVWSGIFDTIANAFSAIVAGLGEFIRAVNWGRVGTAIAEGLNDAVHYHIDWNGIATTLSDLLNGAFDLWYNFVTTFDFKYFGLKVGKNLADAILDIDWEKGATSLAETINGLFEALYGFIVGVNGGTDGSGWHDIGQKVVNSIIAFFGTFSWSDFGTVLSALGEALLSALSGAFEAINWEELPQGVIDAVTDFFSGFNWPGLAEGVGTLLANALKAAVKVGGAVFGKLKEVGKSIINGGFQGIIDFLKDVGNWIKKHIFDPFIEGFKKVFGIHSPASTMLIYGWQIIRGVLQGIINGLLGIGQWIVTHIFNPIVSGIRNAFGFAGNVVSSLFEIGSQLISSFIDGMTEIAAGLVKWLDENIISPIAGAFNKAGEFIDSFFEDHTAYGEELTEEVNLADDLLESLMKLQDTASDADPWNTLLQASQQLREAGELSTEQFDIVAETLETAADGGLSFWEAAQRVAGALSQDNISVQRFNEVLGNTPGAVDSATGSISEMSEKAEDAVENTEGTTSALDALGNMKLSTPFKIALISGAIDNLQKSGNLAEKDASQLRRALEQYKSKPTEDNMKKVSDAFDDVGVSARDMKVAFANSLSALGDITKKELAKVDSAVNEESRKLKKGGDTSGDNFVTGMENSIENGRPGIQKEVKSLVTDDVLGTVDKESDSHSPSREMWKRGQYLTQGLLNGISEGTSAVVVASQNIAQSIMNAFSAYNWNGVGVNIVIGIHNGLVQNWQALMNTAQNMAQSLVNVVRGALGIASPSKVFRDTVGKMIPAGLAVGINEGGDVALKAANDLVNGIVEETAKSSPTITLDTQLNATTDTLSNMLTNYSDIIVDNFTNLISSLERIGNIPAIVQGKIIPYSSSFAPQTQEQHSVSDISAKLDSLLDSRITREDIIDIVQRYINFSFSIGDEQIARHAAAGSLKLDRRFNTVRGTT